MHCLGVNKAESGIGLAEAWGYLALSCHAGGVDQD